MKELYQLYQNSTHTERVEIEELLKTDSFRHVRRKIEEGLRKNTALFLKIAALLEVKKP